MSERAALRGAMWAALQRGVEEGDHPMRLVALATVTEDGFPAVRTVALRALDRHQGWLEVQSDARSAKVAELTRRPRAALLAWDPGTQLQVRARGEVQIRAGEIVRPAWDRVPEESRVAYGSEPAPGTPIRAATDYVKTPDFDRFAVLRLTIEAVDLVDLNEPHRRVIYQRADHFEGTWLAP
ncbi:pyridoxamine 5'-phosphate oxidase family protein [Wenxinia saemankumensis]|uniref:Pyridoxamine 5'-phosphate oxidase n=1 Tax=Wenxinia saemankumensis TaxID=1447782 RepID=A0A1M6ELQ7_9RHOB|nr:pyridoxamine 5'-phosphate oxidase family protein [Wenxinia saemankumensis]SHI86475.1 Pyridoxamine 5'-phosphate oxidase [Wenxinia saemankumensis]